MAYIPGIGYIGSPQDLLYNEWTIFAGIFLLVFAIVFYSIRNFLGKKGEKQYNPFKMKMETSRNDYLIPAIVSGVIAFFTAAAVSQDYLIYRLFGNVLGGWILLFVFIVMFLISLPFIKAVKHAFGGGKWLGALGGVLVAIGYWFFLKSYFIYNSFGYNLYGWAQSAYELAITPSGLVILIIVLGLLGLVLPANRRI